MVSSHQKQLPTRALVYPARFPDPEWKAFPQADLAQRIQAGDREAESELFRQYHDSLMSKIRRQTRDSATAEDLCQETFHLAIVKLRQGALCNPDRLLAFLCSLARNLSTYHYRRQQRRSTWLDESDTDPTETPDPNSYPMGDLLKKEHALLMRRLLDALPTARDREILTRFYLHEEERDVICREMQIAKGHLKRVLHRARQRYRSLYEASTRQQDESVNIDPINISLRNQNPISCTNR